MMLLTKYARSPKGHLSSKGLRGNERIYKDISRNDPLFSVPVRNIRA